ncbi:DUF488 domain-containing protein [Yinghuangia sp. YIM S09857]|uniref:DUF488 domain-containing protein n=1 Tax=Yinghuangia sp. YIM S09857 TaxID=3436929 RepID=UPI003F534FF8
MTKRLAEVPELPTGFRVARVYDAPGPDDGLRVLVDRLWPRGVSKEKAAVDVWAKEVAPSAELRKWFHADPEARADEFAVRYADELDGDTEREGMDRLRAEAAKGNVTLLTAVKDPAGSYLSVLLAKLRESED